MLTEWTLGNGEKEGIKDELWASGLYTWLDCGMIYLYINGPNWGGKSRLLFWLGNKDANYIFMWIFQDSCWLYNSKIERAVRTRDINLGVISWWIVVEDLGSHDIM